VNSDDEARALRVGRAVLALLAELAPQSPHADDVLPIADAARIAGTSVRVVRDAIRAGDLVAYGRQRDRAVRRTDLDRWVESRRLRPVVGVDDGDIERRVLRLARAGGRER
jgi:hypothetical protein